MKSIKILIVLLFIHSLSINAYSQLWKEYSDSAKVYSIQNKIDRAVEYFVNAKNILIKDSSGTVTYAKICNDLGVLYTDQRQYEKAESLYIEAKQIRENFYGKENTDYAASCFNLGRLYRLTNQFKKAELLFIESKQIRERILSKSNPEYATSCYNLAILYRLMGQYDTSEMLFLEAKRIREEIYGKSDPAYVAVCNNLGILYMEIGLFAKAEYFYNEAKNIRQETPGVDHPDYAESCNNLGALYILMGKYEKAKPLFLEAKRVKEKTIGKNNASYARTCDNLGIICTYLGQYENAESFFLEAKQIREDVLPVDHSDYGTSCNNLAGLYNDLGQYKRAELLFLEAKRINEKEGNKKDPFYAGILGNLGNVYSNMEDYEKAESFYLESKRLSEDIFTKNHLQYATCCDNLANLYFKTGHYDQAESLYLEAKQIIEEISDKNNPHYATSCNNLGTLYVNTNQYAKAKPLFMEAREIFHKTVGRERIEYIASCHNLADLYWNLNELQQANTFFTEAYTTQYMAIRKVFQFTSESDKWLYSKTNANFEKRILSFNVQINSPFNRKALYNISISGRNLILSSSLQLRNTIFSGNDTVLINKYNNWINLKEEISFLRTRQPVEEAEQSKNLEESANSLEKELIRLSSAFRKDNEQNDIIWRNIQQGLQVEEAAIEFVSFSYYNGKRITDSIYYIALLLRKNYPDPVLIRLFEKKQLDTLLSKTEGQIVEHRTNSLYNKQSLYNLVWRPLEKHLNGISKIYFASAGDLFKLSFAALPVNDNLMLSDKYHLIKLNTTATVTDKTQSFITAFDKIQLFGGIKYDADSATLKQAAALYQSNTESSRSLPNDLERGEIFKYLPGTLQEAEEIREQAGYINTSVTLLSGVNATEESVKALTGKNSPSVLHIATHGFFFPDPKEDKRDSIQRKFESSGKAFKQSDNPLFRSGLLFAGANNAWQGKPIDGIEDGILTAYEVSNLYLPNTKLVVLSACETALGDIQGSEGVYGLQRAFKMAGVQNLVMSLWKVPDAETAEFMQIFYKNLFAKQTISNAFNNAQQVMKNKYRAEPYKWAAWVLVR